MPAKHCLGYSSRRTHMGHRWRFTIPCWKIQGSFLPLIFGLDVEWEGPISQTRVQFLEKHKSSEQGAFWSESPACIFSEESTKHKTRGMCVCMTEVCRAHVSWKRVSMGRSDGSSFSLEVPLPGYCSLASCWQNKPARVMTKEANN